MNNFIGIYFNQSGYALTKFKVENSRYSLDFVEVSEHASIKQLEARVKEFNVNSIYINNSRVAVLTLMQNYMVEVVSIPIEREAEGTFVQSDAIEIISALLNDSDLIVKEDYLERVESDLQNFSEDSPNPLTLSLLYGIAKHKHDALVSKVYTCSYACASGDYKNSIYPVLEEL